jgi:hypothetical protein
MKTPKNNSKSPDSSLFYSCFICYSSKNFEFVKRLKSELQKAGISIWFAPEDEIFGGMIQYEIDNAIIKYDKFLIILSAESINSRWVKVEVKSAFEKEKKTGKLVLLPVMIDHSIFNIHYGWAKLIKKCRNIGDFTQWKDQDAFAKSFDKLLWSLKKN